MVCFPARPPNEICRAETTVMVQQTLDRMPDYAVTSTYSADDPRRRTSWNERLQRGLTVSFTPGLRLGPDRHLVFNELP